MRVLFHSVYKERKSTGLPDVASLDEAARRPDEAPSQTRPIATEHEGRCDGRRRKNRYEQPVRTVVIAVPGAVRVPAGAAGFYGHKSGQLVLGSGK